MATPFEMGGSKPQKQTRYAPVWVNRFFTGLWTNRNPLRDAASALLQERFYGARYDSLIRGANVELSPRLTIVRRPGTSVYNSSLFPAINAFAEFRTFSGNTETIQVVADTAATVYDATGPSTKTAVFTKGTTAQTYFQTIGNLLFMGNGVDLKKWTGGTPSGTTVTPIGLAAPSVAPGVQASNAAATFGWFTAFTMTGAYYLVDANGNVQFTTFIVFVNTAGFTQPTWATDFGAKTTDNTVTWTNLGVYGPWTPTTTYRLNQVIADPTSGYFQKLTTISDASDSADSSNDTPAFTSVVGTTVTETNANGVTLTWTCVQIGSPRVSFSGAKYAYAYKTNSGNVSNASTTAEYGPLVGVFSQKVSGAYTTQADVTNIEIYRLLDGGSTLLFLAEIANNTAGGTWNYTDTTPDSGLNELRQAAIDNNNNPPPAGMINLAYHLSRLWGSVGNSVYYSRTADATDGNPVECFPPVNVFVFPSLVRRLWPTVSGLLVFTVSDVYLIAGLGIAQSPLYSVPFAAGIGLLNYNLFVASGSVAYIITSDGRLATFDPQAGISDLGLPIADQLALILNAGGGGNYLTWHSSGSTDTALYISQTGVPLPGFGAGTWFRMSATAAPEQGLAWSPGATLASNGLSAMQSIEVLPGVRKLLMGPNAPVSGTAVILQRDTSVFTDNGTAYNAQFTIGSIALANPGQLAELEFLTTDCIPMNGSVPVISVGLDELTTGTSLPNHVADPPQLVASSSIQSSRFYFSPSQAPAWCRNLQITINWQQDTVQNELLAYGIFGAHWQEH